MCLGWQIGLGLAAQRMQMLVNMLLSNISPKTSGQKCIFKWCFLADIFVRRKTLVAAFANYNKYVYIFKKG
jgi:hypothetical protein